MSDYPSVSFTLDTSPDKGRLGSLLHHRLPLMRELSSGSETEGEKFCYYDYPFVSPTARLW